VEFTRGVDCAGGVEATKAMTGAGDASAACGTCGSGSVDNVDGKGEVCSDSAGNGDGCVRDVDGGCIRDGGCVRDGGCIRDGGCVRDGGSIRGCGCAGDGDCNANQRRGELGCAGDGGAN
jgi:hypothetical protein